MFLGLTTADSYIIEFEGDTAITAEQEHEKNNNQNIITGLFLGETVKTSEEVRSQRIEEIKQKQRQLHNHVSDNGSGKISSNYTNVFNGAAVQNISEKEVQKLKELEIVENVIKDGKVKTQMDDAREIVGAEEIWDKQIEDQNLTGKGISVAVIDTGVDYTHESLGECDGTWEEGACEKVPKGYNFVDDSEDPMDDDGHGTHVAGISSGEGDVEGIAPDSQIFAYKSLDEEGTGSFSDIVSAIDQAVEDDADVMILSLGADDGNPDDMLSGAVDQAVEDGVIVSVSAGNNGEDYSVGSPGTARKGITVGATDKQDNLADFSSRGPVEWDEDKMILKPSLVAPGVGIESAEKNGDTVSLSGTSMSAPVVGGAAALVAQKQENWSPNQVKSILMNTALEMENTGFEVGTGRLNLSTAFGKPPIATDKPVINFKEVDFSENPEESLVVENLYDQKLEINLSSQNSRNMFDDKQYSILNLDHEQIILEPGESKSIAVNIDRNPQEGTYYETIDIKDNKTGFTRSNLVSFKQSSNDVTIDLEEPEKDDGVSGDTEFSFSVETNSDETGELELRLNNTVVDTFAHEGGEETYSTTQLKDPGVYNWEVKYLEDSTVSNIRKVQFEDTGMSTSDLNPSNDTEVSFRDREVEFSSEISLEQEAEARLIIENEKIASETFDEGEHTFTTEKELDPGYYNWHIELEAIESGYVQDSEEFSITVNESNLDYSLGSPQNNSEYFTDEEVNFDIDTKTDEQANVSILVDKDTLHYENVSKGEDSLEFSESFSDTGEYEWFLELEGFESDTVNSSDRKFFNVVNNFKIDLISPEDSEIVSWDDREIEFVVEVDSEEDATYELYVDEAVEDEKTVDSEEKSETLTFDFEPSETKEYNWFIRANSEETETVKETEAKTFEVEEVANFNLLDPENETMFKPGTEQVKLNYSIETQDSGNKDLLLNSEVIDTSEQEKGLQNYSKIVEDVESSDYNWSVEFDSDSGNEFKSNSSEFTIEETDISIDKISPEEETINYRDREVDFEFEVEANEDSNVSIMLNSEEEKKNDIERNNRKEFSLTKELEPGEYDWSILVETEETETSEETDTTSFTVQEPEIEIHELNPEEGEEFKHDDEVVISGSFDSDDEGSAKIRANDTEKHFNFDEGENNFEKELDLENGTYQWNLTLGTEFGTEKQTENREFIVHPYTDAEIDLINPDNGKEFEQEEISFDYEIWSNASGIATLEIEDVEEFSQEHEDGGGTYNVETDLVHGEYEWYVRFEDETGRLFDSETRAFEVKTEEIELELLSPENNAELEDREVEFEALIETPVSYDLSLYINGEEFESLEDQESGEFSTVQTLEPGAYTWEIVVSNGNEEVQDSREITIEEEEEEGGETGGPDGSEETDQEDELHEISKEIEDERIEIFDIYSDQNSREEDLEINTDETSLNIQNILLKVPENVENGSITIQKSSISADLIKKQAFSVNSNNITSENHSITFFVESEWLDNNSLLSEEISLYSNGEAVQTDQKSEESDMYYFESILTEGEHFIGAEEPEEGFAISFTGESCREFDNRNSIPSGWEEVDDCSVWEEQQELEEELENISEDIGDEESSAYEETERLIQEGDLEAASERLEQLSREETGSDRSYRSVLFATIIVLVLSIVIVSYKFKSKFEGNKSDKMAAELNEMSDYIQKQLRKGEDFPRRYKVVRNIEKAEKAIENENIEKAAVPLKNAENILKEEKGKEF